MGAEAVTRSQTESKSRTGSHDNRGTSRSQSWKEEQVKRGTSCWSEQRNKGQRTRLGRSQEMLHATQAARKFLHEPRWNSAGCLVTAPAGSGSLLLLMHRFFQLASDVLWFSSFWMHLKQPHKAFFLPEAP